MAELYRRVFRLPNRGRVARLALFALAISFTCSSVSFAQDAEASATSEAITVDVLITHAQALRARDDEARARAVAFLQDLPPSALSAIEERVRRSRRQTVGLERGRQALREFRHETGSRRADDMVDIAPGILPVITKTRSAAYGRMAERVLLARSLEQIGTIEAHRVMLDIYALTSGMWRWELHRFASRQGVKALPILIEGRAHSDSRVRTYCRQAIAEMEMTDRGAAVRQDDPIVLSGVLRAFGKIRDMESMPVVVSFVGVHDDRVRDAAREAMESFGRNGVWQLRLAMKNQLGRDANTSWGWQRTMRVLFEALDERRLRSANERLERGLAAFEEESYAEAVRLFDEVLLEEPLLPRRSEMAPAFSALADQSEDADEKRRLTLRAVWLDTSGPWRAKMMAEQAQADLEAGVADVEALRSTLMIDPQNELAAELLTELTGEEVVDVVGEERAPSDPRSFGWLFVLIGALLLALTMTKKVRGLDALGQKARAWLRRFEESTRPETLNGANAVSEVGTRPSLEPESELTRAAENLLSTDQTLDTAIADDAMLSSLLFGHADVICDTATFDPDALFAESSPGAISAP